MDSSSMLQMGSLPVGAPCITRPGSYAVLFNEKGETGIVRTKNDDFLLAGGGIEAGESQEEALMREILEETGLLVTLGLFLGTAAEYYFDPGQERYYNKVGHFFLVTPTGEDRAQKIEDDHTLAWLPLQKAIPLMYHDIYRWALERGWSRYRPA